MRNKKAPSRALKARRSYRFMLRPHRWLAALRRRATHEGKPLTEDDALWNIVGMGESKGPGDTSENKHKYLI